MLVRQNEAAWIGQPFNPLHCRDTAKRRKQHGKAERQVVRLLDCPIFGQLLDMHLAIFDFGHAGIGDPLDRPLAQFTFEQGLGIADTIKAEMANIGLSRDEGHRHPVADLAALQFGIQDQREFIRRTIAGCPLRRANDDRLRISAKPLKSIGSVGRMIGAADRLCVVPWPKAFDLVEGQVRSGRDHQVVVVQ